MSPLPPGPSTSLPAVPPLVTVEDVSLFLPGDARQRMVLHHICWQVARGAHCALLGPNGAGKSTLLRLLHGELWPAHGHIYWHTREGAEGSPLAGRGMSALVSPARQEQYQRQAWDITGRELLLTGQDDTPLLYRRAPAAHEAAVEALATRLHVQDLLARPMPSLSQGQLRLLLLGRALLRQPALLLLDECTDGLDAARKKLFFDVLEAHAETCTVILTAHRPADIPAWCGQRRHMHEGHLHSAPPAHAGGAPLPPPQSPCRAVAAPTGRALLDMEHVSVFIERHKVLHDVSWSLHQGEHWRITGANGSGKSTLLRLLAGDEFAAAGGTLRRWLPGQGGAVDTLAAVRRGVRLVSDLSQALYGFTLNGLELVCSGYDNSVGLYREFTEAERDTALTVMARLFPEGNAARMAESSIRLLSSGQLRRLFLARALVGGPDILLLDEPCSGLDAESRAMYLTLLDQLAEGHPATSSGRAGPDMERATEQAKEQTEGQNGGQTAGYKPGKVHLVFVSHHGEDAPLCINREARMQDGRLTVLHRKTG